jgi:hypothetical protein
VHTLGCPLLGWNVVAECLAKPFLVYWVAALCIHSFYCCPALRNGCSHLAVQVPNKPYGEWLDVYVALLAPPPPPTGGLFSVKNH